MIRGDEKVSDCAWHAVRDSVVLSAMFEEGKEAPDICKRNEEVCVNWKMEAVNGSSYDSNGKLAPTSRQPRWNFLTERRWKSSVLEKLMWASVSRYAINIPHRKCSEIHALPSIKTFIIENNFICAAVMREAHFGPAKFPSWEEEKAFQGNWESFVDS